MAIPSFLPYTEPDIITILVLISFLLLSNVIGFTLDKLLYCGAIGQILLGTAWGTPGSKWLSDTQEATIAQLGYLGLICLVYEGGLSTSLPLLKAHLFLSICVALTGISLPIAFSFVMTALTKASKLQAFAAGAALCSTSLGTTLTVLQASGLTGTRLGVVLTSAAMMDDVIGLVMVQIVTTLGNTKESITASVIIRPVCVSIAFGVCVPLACWLVVKPATQALDQIREAKPDGQVNKFLSRPESALVYQTALLISLLTAASYAGTSNLFAAYLAGAIVTWWDTDVAHVTVDVTQEASMRQPRRAMTAVVAAAVVGEGNVSTYANEQRAVSHVQQASSFDSVARETHGTAIYAHYFETIIQKILKPFFFSSVGFSIPISSMFSAEIVWKGILYTILMIIGKLMCGIWLVRVSLPRLQLQRSFSALTSARWKLYNAFKTCFTKDDHSPNRRTAAPLKEKASKLKLSNERSRSVSHTNTTALPELLSGTKPAESSQTPRSQASRYTSKPVSLYPSAILASAMVARGEIGFLIAALAQGNGIFNAESPVPGTDVEPKIFLIVTWAIMLCTLLGPVSVGTLVRRVKKLESDSSSNGERRIEGRKDVLGAWGIQ